MSTFWSIWIIVFTAITIVGCTWLLFANRKVEVSDDTKEGESPKTGHVYDGIEEYDNPLPGWWFKMFVGTVVFGVIYLVLTFLCFLAYLGADMTPFEAINHAMTTVATGGFSTHDASIGAFSDGGADIVALVFMVLAGLHQASSPGWLPG